MNSKKPKQDILKDILSATLASLHCYILHKKGDLFRMLNETQENSNRFGSAKPNHTFCDFLDNKNYYHKANECERKPKKLNDLIQWLFDEHLDSEGH